MVKYMCCGIAVERYKALEIYTIYIARKVRSDDGLESDE